MKNKKKEKEKSQIDRCTEYSLTDKKRLTVCLPTLEKLWNEALNANKQPFIVLGIRRNDEEVFTIEGILSVEKQRRSK